MPNIYVLSKSGNPLMPVHSYARARKLIKSGKARIAATVPFTIQLTYGIEEPVVDDCLLGIDPGRTNIGLCVIDSKGKVLFASDVETRNKMIAKLMLERKAHRQASRRGERLRRQRRAISADKSGMAAHTEFWRMLPGYEEPICCRVIRNTAARFNNRKRPEGWLTPTARQLLETHINLIRKLQKILPISGIVLEINRFDFAKMENPNIQNWEYQKGKLFGFKDKYEAISYRQEGLCLLCKKSSIKHYHHLIPRHLGGSDTLDNLAGLCNRCHGRVHTEPAAYKSLQDKATGLKKKYHALSVINEIMPKLLNSLSDMLTLYVTTGYETSTIRTSYNLEKDHYVDAWCIAISALKSSEPDTPIFDSIHNIRQFRRHDRQLVKAQRERTYILDGKTIAKNRKPRFEQSGPSLQETGLSQQEITRLIVKPSRRYYNNPNRVMPGAVVKCNNNVFVLTGSLTGGVYYRGTDNKTNYPAKQSSILYHNTGLVYI